MEPFRLKLKVGPHEFEAEGDQEMVERQLTVWRELIASTPAIAPSPPPASGAPAPAVEPPASAAKHDKIFRHEGRVVSLSIVPNGESAAADAALLVLLGQRLYNQLDLVTGSQVLDGLKRSGVTGVKRANWTLGEYIPEYVMQSGARRATVYRLTNPGMAKAEELARELEKKVP